MVEVKDIVDRESLEAWLGENPVRVSGYLANTMAMRVLPVSLEWVLLGNQKTKPNITALNILWPSLISYVCSIGVISEKYYEPQLNLTYSKEAAFSVFQETTLGSFSQITSLASVANAALALRYSLSVFTLHDFVKEAASAVSAGIAVVAGKDLDPEEQPEMWNILQADIMFFERKLKPVHVLLWPKFYNPFEDNWIAVKNRLSEDSVDWSFWINWYESVLKGDLLNFKMLERVALIPTIDWEKGPAHVNAIIAEIEEEFEVPQISTNYTKSIQQAVAQNKAGIAPQIEALTDMLSAEIEKLRGRNPADEIEQEENERLRAIFEGLRVAIVKLGALIPNSGEPSQGDAEEIEGLLKVYVGEFQKWPRENAADMVDSTVRVALVGMTAGVVTLFGASALVGVAIGGIAFGGKKLAGAAKALKDSSSGGS